MTRTTIVIAVILLCALVLRLYHLDRYDLWFDELGTEMYTARNLGVMASNGGLSKISMMFDQIKNDPHSLTYYLMIYLYSFLFRDNVPLRMFSVIFSMLSLWIFYRFSRLFFNRRTSLYALLIMSFNPFHLWYAQEARMYAMLCFFSLLTMYLYIKALKKDKIFYWVGFALSGVLSILSSYHFVFLLMVSGAALFWEQNRRHFIKWLGAVVFILLFLVIFKQVLSSQLSFVKNSFWLQSPPMTTLWHTWMFYSLGYSATDTQYEIGMRLFLIFFVYGVVSCFLDDKRKAIFLFLCLFFPIMAIYAFSKIIMPIYIHRQLLIFSPFYYLFIAKGLESFPYKHIQIPVVLSLVILMGASVVNYYGGDNPSALSGTFPKKNYHTMLLSMRNEFQTGDLIAAADVQAYVMARSEIIKHYQQYNLSLDRVFFLSHPKYLTAFDKRFMNIEKLVGMLSVDERMNLYGFAFMKDGKMGKVETPLEDDDVRRVWLLTSSFVNQEPFDSNIIQVNDYMLKHFRKIFSGGKDGVYIELYSR